MTKGYILYKKGYKYQLYDSYLSCTKICPPATIRTDWIVLSKEGVLEVSKGYAWDGPSGPTIDDRTNMRGSLEHDAFYQLMRLGLLPLEYRDWVDKRLKVTCKEDGMNPVRASIWETMVHLFARKAATESGGPSLYVAGKKS